MKSLFRRRRWYVLAYTLVACSGSTRTLPPSAPSPLPSSPPQQQPELTIPTADSWSLKYAPGTMSYQIVRSATIESQSGPSSHKEVSGNTTHEQVTLDSTELGIGFTAVVDTFSTTTQGSIGSAQAVQLPVQISGVLAGDSLTITSQLPNEKCSATGSALTTDLHNLLTHFPIQLSPGMSWRDSIEVSGCQATIPTISHIVRSYIVVGEISYEGRPVIKIQRSDTTQAHGEGGLQQHRVLLDANGTGTAVYYLDPTAGRVMHLTVDQNLRLTVTASGTPYHFEQDSKQVFNFVP